MVGRREAPAAESASATPAGRDQHVNAEPPMIRALHPGTKKPAGSAVAEASASAGSASASGMMTEGSLEVHIVEIVV